MSVDASVPRIALVDDGIGFDAKSSRIGLTAVSAEIPPECPEFGVRCE